VRQLDVFSELLLDAQSARTVYIVTLTKSPPSFQQHLGQQLLVYPEGLVKGCIANESFTTEISQTVMERKWQQPCRFQLTGRPEFEFFWDKLIQKRQALIFGGGHISQPLVDILSLIGYSVTIVDDRPDFANQARFPKAETVFCGSFETAFSEIEIGKTTAVIIVTRGHQHDLACLRHAIGSLGFYIGMIGSRRKSSLIFNTLRDEGIADSAIRNVRAPIGLDLQGQTPAEIALSVAAEILAMEKGGTGLPLSMVWRSETVD
jgi:xanthine dehydrogenase accessory factor